MRGACYNLLVNREMHCTPSFLYALLGLSILLAVGSLAYRNFRLEEERSRLETELSTMREEYASTSVHLLADIDTLGQLLATTTKERDNLEENLEEEQILIDLMRSQVESVVGAVDTLKKINGIDRELLQKYSRVYFLNENYVPKDVVVIPDDYAYEPENKKPILDEVWPFLKQLIDDAAKEGIDLRVISGYRSFGTQGLLKSTYIVSYGNRYASQFSADQGYSEHQLGSTVDFTTLELGANFTAFGKTEAYRWLTDHAYEYGFVASYPKTNTYYIFEPWHWRFVGKKLAQELYANNKYFYDIPQRDIDTYIGFLFDN